MPQTNWDLVHHTVNSSALQVLSELLHAERPFSVYDFDKRFSLKQYRYALQKLEAQLVIMSEKTHQKKQYWLNDFCREFVARLVQLLSRDESPSVQLPLPLKANPRFLSLLYWLKEERNWALSGTSALVQWVPFLNVSLARLQLAVQNRALKTKIEHNFPSDLVEVRLSPSFFTRAREVSHLNELPTLEPGSLFFPLLGYENERVSLSALFLIPYLTPLALTRSLHNHMNFFPTLMYSLLALQLFLQRDSYNPFLHEWFHNLSQHDLTGYLEQYVRHLGTKTMRRRTSTSLKRSTIKKVQYLLRTGQWNEWDRLAMLFPERTMKVVPESLRELISPLIS